MAYDAARGRTVLFGGATGVSTPLSDTWEWDGNSWIAHAPASSPSARNGHAMAYDAARQRVVLFGGGSASGSASLFSDTWEWDGSNWVSRSPSVKPPARIMHSLCYDAARGRIVLYGGYGGTTTTVYTDVWEWDGASWAQRPTAQAPLSAIASLCYDPATARAVLFGGYAFGAGAQAETWSYGATSPAAFTAFGVGCAGAGGVPALAAEPGSLPWLGDAFTARLSNLGPSPTLHVPFVLLGDSATQWGAFSLPLDLGPFGMPGCTALTNAVVSFSLANQTGFALWTGQVPTLPSLLGVSLYAQGGVTSPGMNPFGLALGNAGKLTLSAR